MPTPQPDPLTLRAHTIASRWNVAFFLWLWASHPTRAITTAEMMAWMPHGAYALEPREVRRLEILGVLPVSS